MPKRLYFYPNFNGRIDIFTFCLTTYWLVSFLLTKFLSYFPSNTKSFAHSVAHTCKLSFAICQKHNFISTFEIQAWISASTLFKDTESVCLDNRFAKEPDGSKQPCQALLHFPGTIARSSACARSRNPFLSPLLPVPQESVAHKCEDCCQRNEFSCGTVSLLKQWYGTATL